METIERQNVERVDLERIDGPAFSPAEYAHRLGRTREVMAQRGIDVLLVAAPDNINYLCGYDGWSFYMPQVLIVDIEAEQPIWIGRASDAAGARFTTYLPDDRVIGYPEHYVHARDRHAMSHVAQVMVDHGRSKGTVAIDMDSFYLTPRALDTLRRDLPDCQIVDADRLVNWVRVIKSDAEIAYMRKAGQLADEAMRAAVDTIRPGARQCDVAAAIYHAKVAGHPEHEGDYTALAPLVMVGERSSAPHIGWTGAPLEPGQNTMIELAGCYKRYHCPLARTVYLGTPPDKVRRVADALGEGVEATLNAIQPGMTGAEVEGVWRHTIARYGLEKPSRLGYSIGVGYPPDWGEGTISLRPEETTVLQPNMTFHLMPGIWLDDFGIETSQSFRVTEDGCESLSSSPREFIVKD